MGSAGARVRINGGRFDEGFTRSCGVLCRFRWDQMEFYHMKPLPHMHARGVAGQFPLIAKLVNPRKQSSSCGKIYDDRLTHSYAGQKGQQRPGH